MRIHLIWAQEEDGGIGVQGKLPWHISEDLQNFKQLTLNSTILMGRKTWESLPFKPLPKRRNIVLSSKKKINSECYQSVEECLSKLLEQEVDKLFIIGGSKVYQNFINRADELHITQINKTTKGIDTYFPITIEEIEKHFSKIKEIKLSDNAIYSNWSKL